MSGYERCPVTEDWCTRQCSLLCDRIGDGAEPEDVDRLDCTGWLRPHEREAMFGYEDPAVWSDVDPDPMDLGETVPWPMGAEQ